LDLALPKIPKKALYKLQINVTQNIQSMERSDAMNLQIAQEENMTLKEVINQEGQENKITHQKVEEMEKYIGAVFRTIQDSVDSEGGSTKENMMKISQALE
jgi:hypothetical protein